MKNVSATTLTVFLVATLLGGCALFGKAARAPHPVVGDWLYNIDTPQGAFTGLFTFAEAEGAFSGTITADQGDGTAQPLQELLVNESDVTFKFNGGEYGNISVRMTLEGDAMSGSLDVPAVGATGMPITASRRAAE